MLPSNGRLSGTSAASRSSESGPWKEARVTGEHQFAVVNLNLTFFSGDAATTVETIILSPAATFLPEAKLAHGEESVRFIRDDVEASGTRWVYNHGEIKISLDGDVRVTFRAELKDILK